jgi:hypothetical protein
MLLQFVSVATGLGSLVCYILVVIKMFQHGKTGPAVGSIVGLIACGLGALFAFIYGWMKAGEWRIKNIMIAWTLCLVLNLGLTIVTLPAAIQKAREEAIQPQQRQEQRQNPAIPPPGAPAPVPEPVPSPEPAPAKP